MARVRIVHWKAAESGPVIEACRACGFEVEFEAGDLPAVWRKIRAKVPDVVAIDLTRAPSQGRDLAFAMRQSKVTRRIPIVFVDGEAEKVEAIRQKLPDAFYASRRQLCARIRTALRTVIANPVTPPPMMESYGSRSTAQKLGIAAGATVGVFDAPRDYLAALGALPEDVEVVEEPASICKITLWFVSDLEVYQAGLRRMKAMADRTKLWVVWRKGSSNGLTQFVIRNGAIEVGLVDYKICRINETWSGMAFARRRK
jgi:CheY-like chemotaxis protein